MLQTYRDQPFKHYTNIKMISAKSRAGGTFAHSAGCYALLPAAADNSGPSSIGMPDPIPEASLYALPPTQIPGSTVPSQLPNTDPSQAAALQSLSVMVEQYPQLLANLQALAGLSSESAPASLSQNHCQSNTLQSHQVPLLKLSSTGK